MPHHFSVLAARRDHVYYVNGTKIYFKPEDDPDFVPQEPTHTLADLIGLFQGYAGLAADHEDPHDPTSEGIHRVIHRIIVHQGGAMVDGYIIWYNTYPEWGEEIGWLAVENCDDHYDSFQRDMNDRSIAPDSEEWKREWREMEERIALSERHKYYQGWNIHDLDIILPIARNIKVAWVNPVPPLVLEPSEQDLRDMESDGMTESLEGDLPWE
jgi:hypothetical protein